MGRLVVEQLVTADGYTADPGGSLSFGPAESDDGSAQVDFLRRVDAIVLGRRTYQMFVEFWPFVRAEDDPVSAAINTLPLHVISSTLREAPWGPHRPAQVAAGDGVEAVREVKNRYERDVVLWGSLSLSDALFRAGLVDVLRLRTMPALTGQGRRLTPPLDLVPLTLIGVEQHGDQVVLEYALHS